jgi:CRISPR type I-E-associated protein CasB/Cse2
MVNQFIANLTKMDNTDRSRLKRQIGTTLAQSRDLMVFYRVMPYGVAQHKEDDFFLVATLFPLIAHTDNGKDFGHLLHGVRKEQGVSEGQNSLDLRVEALIYSSRHNLGFRLPQMVRYVCNFDRSASLDWGTFLVHIWDWEHKTRYVQKQWARSYVNGGTQQ